MSIAPTMRMAAVPPATTPWGQSRHHHLLAPRAPCSPPASHNGEGHWRDPGLTLPGMTATCKGCSVEQLAAAACNCGLPSPAERWRLVRRLADRTDLPMVHTLAANMQCQGSAPPPARSSLLAASSSGGGGCYFSDAASSISVPARGTVCTSPCPQVDAVWAYGRGVAKSGDVWCLLSLARLAIELAADSRAALPRRRAHGTALRLMRQAAAAVHAAPRDWDVWLRGGAHAALGSFVVLVSSGGSGADMAGQLAGMTALVADAASEEGGAELWLLLDILVQQQARLHLSICADMS